MFRQSRLPIHPLTCPSNVWRQSDLQPILHIVPLSCPCSLWQFQAMIEKNMAQVGRVSGTGQCGEWRRSDFTLLTSARNRRSEPFSGAGPPPQNGPAPSTPPSCTRDPTDLHHPLPETAAIAKNRHQGAVQVQTRQGFGPKRRFPSRHCKNSAPEGNSGANAARIWAQKAVSPNRDCKKSAPERNSGATQQGLGPSANAAVHYAGDGHRTQPGAAADGARNRCRF